MDTLVDMCGLLLGFGWPVFAGVLLVRRVTIARQDAVAPALSISLAAGDAIALDTRRRAVIGLVAGTALIALMWRIGVHVAVLYSIGLAFAMQSYLNAWRARHLMALPRASAELRGTTLTACSDGTHASVIVSCRAAAGVAEHAVPRAKIV
ncbi:MAG TPA: hypothetical protein VGL61_16235 [Kofleriaceae bacterium]